MDTGETMDGVISVVSDAIGAMAEQPINIYGAVLYTRFKKKEMKEKEIIFGEKIKKINNNNPWLIFPWDLGGVL
jgi:hypothetical protein